MPEQSLTEKLAQGGMVAVIGLCTVFLVLIILWVIIEVMHVVVSKIEKKPAEVKQAPANNVQKNNVVVNNVAPINPADLAPLPQGDPKQDKQFVAAVMGAIAGYTGADSFDFKIKSIKKL